MGNRKTLGVKVEQRIYDEFKHLDGNVSTNLRTAIENHIKHSKETRLTTVNQKKNVCEYQTLTKQQIKNIVGEYQNILSELEEYKEKTQRYVEKLRNNKCGTWASMLDCTVELSDLIREIIELQLSSLSRSLDDNQGLVEHDDQCNSTWESA